MPVKNYYRWALLLPLAVPALASPLLLLEPKAPGLVVVLMYLFWSLLFGGVPYLLFAAGFLVWIRRAPEHRVRAGVLLSPLVYAAVLLVCFTLFLVVDGTLVNSAEFLGMLAIFAVFFGYAYVALAEAGRALLGAAPVRAEPVPAA
ncbi:MAG TPA: hypothetical protein VGC13_02065 [Longimicrobium sp.]|jgi:hypothetical protein|uniref:hypothetical protein n=1 Tax=Longimicrobium sp. TaxID=2029185 RepID=UPI002ED9EE58